MSARVSLEAGFFAATLLAAGTFATDAAAYCRARTCDPEKTECHKEAGCITSGHLLYWPSSCVTFAVQEDGSPHNGLDVDTVTEVASRAFDAWLNADCDGESPALRVGSLGPVVCNQSRYNEEGKNANVIMFRDDGWPYPGSDDAYALTRVHFNTATGEIVDADIEINSSDFTLTTDGSAGRADLQSILTHEAGHFLGLAHAADTDLPDQLAPTMRNGWNGAGTALRTLTADDEAGLCEAFAPGRSAGSSCEPHNGFSSECNVPANTETEGCTLTRLPRSGTGTQPFGVLVAGCALVSLQLRRARRTCRAPKAASSRAV